ncbi:hypothetical protein BJ508DRAFT_326677, partial [Ascobolus immersus RN42]
MSTPTSSQPLTATVTQQPSDGSTSAQQQPGSPRSVNKLPTELLMKIFDCIGETRNWKDFRAFRHISPRTVLASNCTERIDSYGYHIMGEHWIERIGKAIEGPNVFWRSLLWECGVRVPPYAQPGYTPPVLGRRKNNEAEEAFWYINMERLVARVIYTLARDELVTANYTTDGQEAFLQARDLHRTCSLDEISAQFVLISKRIGVRKQELVLEELDDMAHDWGTLTQFTGLERGTLVDSELELSDDVMALGKIKTVVDRYRRAVDF